jgi:hypothetical protein
LEEKMARFYKIEELRQLAVTGDVRLELTRCGYLTGKRNTSEVQEVLRLGYYHEALNWLISATAGGMASGLYTRRQRLDEARKMADDAGIDLLELAAENGLSDLL